MSLLTVPEQRRLGSRRSPDAGVGASALRGVDDTLHARRRLRSAISAGLLSVRYEPEACPTTGRVVTVRARLHGPRAEPDVLAAAGPWLLDEACRQLRAWQDAGLAALDLTVALSSRALRSPALARRVAEVLTTHALPARRLELSVGEAQLCDLETVLPRLQALRALGVRLAVDDFGTATSSLRYLTQVELDALRVTSAVAATPAASGVLAATVALAHELGLQVVADDVDDPAQLASARAAGVDRVRGCLVGVPLPSDGVAELLEDATVARPAQPVAPHIAAPTTPLAGTSIAHVQRARGYDRAPLLERAVRYLLILMAAYLGVRLAAPWLATGASSCPAQGEGRGQCLLQHNYAPFATIVLGCVLGAWLAYAGARSLLVRAARQLVA